MKIAFAVTVLTATFVCGNFPAHAADRGARRPAQKRSEPAEVASASGSPVAELRPYVAQLEPLLAVERPRSEQFQKFARQVPGRLSDLRRRLEALRSTANAADIPRLDVATSICDGILRGLDERQKLVEQLKALGAGRGPGGGGLRAADRLRWLQRSSELRHQIEASYGRIAAAENG